MNKLMKQNKIKLIAIFLFFIVAITIILANIFDKTLDIGTTRQFFWNTQLIDTDKTTATYTLHTPERQNIVLTTDNDWEGETADNICIVETDDGYAMYYSTYSAKDDVKICYAVSDDGKIWNKPALNVVQFNGSSANNILFDKSSGISGGFFVMKDTNTNVSDQEKYKAIAVKNDGIFVTYVSADGINWEEKSSLKIGDNYYAQSSATLSSLFWNEKEHKYFCYFIKEQDGNTQTMLSVSNNFEDWSTADKVSFESSAEFSFQTANVMPYYRENSTLIGMPLRITDISENDATTNFSSNSVISDKLTDTVFVSSVNGNNFKVNAQAYLTPGSQNSNNWIFGDSFIANGLIETTTFYSDKGGDNELSLFVAENMLNGNDTDIVRYTTRIDGFASYNSPFNTTRVVTQPLKFGGKRMTINFKTSADGYVFVRILNEDGTPFKDIEYTRDNGNVYNVSKYTSYKLLGDRVDREVVFNSDISKLVGKTVRLEFIMSDADIYSFAFDNNEYTGTGDWLPDEIIIREYDSLQYSYDSDVIDIGTDRQLFLDDYIINTEKTDALHLSHSPVKKEAVFETDLPWEGDSCDFYITVNDVDSFGNDYYRMYYLGWNKSADSGDVKVCYAYSYDGINWIKPSLNLNSFTDPNTNETYNSTNILLFHEDYFDNFFVFKDTRPGVPASERYKAIAQGAFDQQGYSSFGLWAWVSPDGINWKKVHRALPHLEEWFGSFDSVNTMVWDESTQQFFLFFRVRDDKVVNGYDIPDFKYVYGATAYEFEPFSTDTMYPLNYGEGSPEFELYTNNIIKYYRAPQMFIGTPTRFNRNLLWIKNYEYLAGAEKRIENYNTGYVTRTLSTTDGMFMSSRDGYNWNRQNEAFVTPGPEYEANWIYGNCYPAYGMIETKSDISGADNEISFYIFEGKFYAEPSIMYRYTLRLDGFNSYKGDYDSQKVTTKPITFEGNKMLLNFKTSAAGNVQVNILDENGTPIDGYSSGKLIGDNTDRVVCFENDLSALNGKTVSIEFILCDAEIYSFIFQ